MLVKTLETDIEKNDHSLVPPYIEIRVVDTELSLETLDPDAYLAMNLDVAQAGLDARYHFETYGMTERRCQLTNRPEIARLRDQKLSSVEFRSFPISTNETGQMDFISSAKKAEFGINGAVPVAANDYSDEIVSLIRSNPASRFLDVGAGLRHTYFSNVVNAEIWASGSTDVICVGEDLPFQNAQFDFVICLAALEHTMRPWVVAEEIIRVTKPGGMIRVDWPFLQPVHGYPHHYFNATPRGHVSLFERECEIESCDVRIWQHPIFSLTWILNEWRAGLPEEIRSTFDETRLGDLVGKAGDHLLKTICRDLSRSAQDAIAAGTTMIARKKI